MNTSAHYGPIIASHHDLVDVALHRPATQSSLSEWSQPEEASLAVSGQRPADFAFHTAREQRPWWLVDLGDDIPIEVIVVSNRIGASRDRCSSLRVEVSSDKILWRTLHAGFTIFGTRWENDAFTLWLKGAIAARYVRLSLDNTDVLHLSQVEIFSQRSTYSFLKYCKTNGLTSLRKMNDECGDLYKITNNANASNNIVVGLDISYSARFGNLMIQYANAIMLARKTGLKYLKLGEHPLLRIKEVFEVDGLTFLPFEAVLPSDGCFLSGDFFISDPFVPVLMPFLRFTAEDEHAFTGVTREFIRPYILSGVPLPDEYHPDDEVTVHLRAGDVFAPYTPVVRGYRQPPLSFYVLVISNLFENHGVRRARLVFEDRGNPCVDALETWLKEQDIPVRLQCSSLVEDLSALIDAPHLVFGHGTFGYAACRLSKHVKTLHYFEPELGGAYGSIRSIDRVFSVSDSQGKYIKAFEYAKPFHEDEGWFNTPENYRTMISYPLEALELVELTREMRLAERKQ